MSELYSEIACEAVFGVQGIYFAQSGNGLIKIGKSNDIGQRIRSLNTQSPVPVWLAAYEETADTDRREQELHSLFDHARVRFEWFAPVHELRMHINRLLRGAEFPILNCDGFEFPERLTDMELRLLSIIHGYNDAVSSPMLTEAINEHLKVNYFTLNYHLKKLEDRGLLSRPNGSRSGWFVVVS